MKNDKKLKKINLDFTNQSWFDYAYATMYKNEYVIVVKKYPYTEEHLFFEYEKSNKVRIRIHTLG